MKTNRTKFCLIGIGVSELRDAALADPQSLQIVVSKSEQSLFAMTQRGVQNDS